MGQLSDSIKDAHKKFIKEKKENLNERQRIEAELNNHPLTKKLQSLNRSAGAIANMCRSQICHAIRPYTSTMLHRINIMSLIEDDDITIEGLYRVLGNSKVSKMILCGSEVEDMIKNAKSVTIDKEHVANVDSGMRIITESSIKAREMPE